MKTLYCFYDMAVSPCSYDFFTFLYLAETCRVRRKMDKIQLMIVHGPKNKFREDNVRSDEQNETFFQNIIVPGISLLPSCFSYMWLQRGQTSFNGLSESQKFPRGYSLDNPVSDYLASGLVASLIRMDKPGFLEAPTYAKMLADNIIRNKCPDGKFVTITAREIGRDNTNDTRTLNLNVWQEAISKLVPMGLKIFVIRDTQNANEAKLFQDTEELPEASIHLPLRLALYEKALINFTKNNGPGALQLYSKARTIYFNAFDDDVFALSKPWFLNVLGMHDGDQHPFTTLSKKWVWNDESIDRIVDEAKEALNVNLDNSNLNGFSNLENLRASVVVAFNYLVKQLKHGLLKEDAQLFINLRDLNKNHNLFTDLNKQLIALSDNGLKRDVVSELLRKTGK